MRYAVLPVIALAAIGSVASADITSTFDASAEGWGITANGDTFTWDAGIGNPAGAIRGNESGTNQLWYFTSSTAYHGNQSAHIGGSLSWDLLGFTSGSAAGAAADVIIEGAGLRIGFAIPGNIDTSTWQTFSVPLTFGGWYTLPAYPASNASGPAITEAQFNAVMSGITALYIQGEYRNGNDTSAIDNVRMIVPAPGAAALIGLGAMGVARRRRTA